MTSLPSTSDLDIWVGHACEKICHREHDWAFQFGSVGGIGSAACPWRIIAAGRIAFADNDDGQIFGLPKAVDGVERATALLSRKKIASVEVSPVSGDLRVHFDGGTILEFFNNSMGYEGWNASARNGSKSTNIVALGGGELAIYSDARTP